MENGDVYILKGDDDNSDYTLKKYVIQQNKVIQVNDAENKFVLFHEKILGGLFRFVINGKNLGMNHLVKT